MLKKQSATVENAVGSGAESLPKQHLKIPKEIRRRKAAIAKWIEMLATRIRCTKGRPVEMAADHTAQEIPADAGSGVVIYRCDLKPSEAEFVIFNKLKQFDRIWV